MRHHEPLIAMRRRGIKPREVSIEIASCLPGARYWPILSPNDAQLALDIDENPRLLDLRFLVGCNVSIFGYHPADETRLALRFRQLFEASIRARVNSATVCHLFPNDEVLLWHA